MTSTFSTADPVGHVSPQGLNALSRGVLGEVQAEARQALEDARVKAEDTRRRAQKQAVTRHQEILERAKREAQPLYSQAVAAAQLEAQKLRLESRERLLGQVFSSVREELKSAPQWPDYPEVLDHLIRETMANLAVDEIILYADSQTQKYLSDSLLAELGCELGVHLRRGEIFEGGVGIVAETPDGHRRYQNTLEARLQRLQKLLRAPVYRLLRGESP